MWSISNEERLKTEMKKKLQICRQPTSDEKLKINRHGFLLNLSICFCWQQALPLAPFVMETEDIGSCCSCGSHSGLHGVAVGSSMLSMLVGLSIK